MEKMKEGIVREIKFRAWDKVNREMTNVVTIYCHGSDGNMWCFSAVFKGKTVSNNFGDTLKLMQYTGLKDKNGTEIYESDILLSADGLRKYEVRDDNKRGCWYGHGLQNTWNSNYLQWDNFKIIGNIHSNTELLK